MGQDGSIGIATRWGLDVLGMESMWAIFSTPVLTGPGAHPASYTVGTGFLPRGRLGCGVNHPSPTTVEVKETVELYVYSPSGPSWQVIG